MAPTFSKEEKIAIAFGRSRHCTGGRSRQSILHTFIGEHEEHLVFAVEQFGNPNWTGKHSAVLIESADGFLGAGFIGEKGSGVECGVLIELIQGAVEIVAATASDHVDCAAAAVPIGRISLETFGFYFSHCIHGRVIGHAQVPCIVSCSVQQ